MASAAASVSWKGAVDRALGCINYVGGGLEESKEARGEDEGVSIKSSRINVFMDEGLVVTERMAGADMDPQIWATLPFHLLECVLAWLPVPSLLKLRCVCKKFNSILYSPRLWATRRRVLKCVPAWFLFRGEGRECVAFNPDADSWVKLPLALFLPTRSKGRVVAAAGGLLCVRQGDKMLICNPLSKSWLELPPRKNTCKFPIVGMAMDTDVEAYKVVVAGRNSSAAPTSCGKNLVTEVYCSLTKTWKEVDDYGPVDHHYQTSAVYSNGSLYSAGFDEVLVFDLEQEQWSEMKGPSMQETQLMLPQICECNGCLLMVEVVSEHFLMSRVSIWALLLDHLIANQSPSWFKLASMPPKVLQEVITISGIRMFTYFGHGDYMCFTIARRRVLVYSLSRRRWRWLPRCPFVQGFARRFTTLAYEPRVEAQV